MFLYYVSSLQVDARKRTLAKYLMELTIIQYDMVQYNPSEIAAAALCLSIKLLDGSQWVRHFSVSIVKYSIKAFSEGSSGTFSTEILWRPRSKAPHRDNFIRLSHFAFSGTSCFPRITDCCTSHEDHYVRRHHIVHRL